MTVAAVKSCVKNRHILKKKKKAGSVVRGYEWTM